MKEFSGTAINYYWRETDSGKMKPMCELIIIVSEPQFRVGSDDLIRERISETYRIGIQKEGVKLLIKTLLEIEKELEEKGELKIETK